MFNKMKKAKDKLGHLREIDKINLSKFKSTNITLIKNELNEAIKKILIDASDGSKDFLFNDEKLTKAADISYKSLPPPVKLFLRKKRFRSLVFLVRDRCREKKDNEIDQCGIEIIEENLEG